MSVGSVSASYGTVANNPDTQWRFVQLISWNYEPLNKSDHVVERGVTALKDITLDNCKVGIKNTQQHLWEAIFSSDGKIKLNNCEAKGIVSAPNHTTESENCLIEGKVSGYNGAIHLTATEIRSQDYTDVKLMPQSGFYDWICPVKDRDDAVYQFNMSEVDYYKDLLKPAIGGEILSHVAIENVDNSIRCENKCKIYGDVVILFYENGFPTRNIEIIGSTVAGNLLNRAGDILVEKSRAKAIYNNIGKTEINDSTVEFICTRDSNTLIHNHSVVRQGGILGGQNNEILSSTVHGSLKLLGQNLKMGKEAVVDEICLPRLDEATGFIPQITLESGATLHSLVTNDYPCRLGIEEGATFTPLNHPETLPENLEIYYF
ncbi:hypothetical protein SC171_25525 [Pantoea cypripedii]|uniref:hypothetical protein n=1 Tax=Pantoea cypripedii TaxID=55209 RepID=UPI002FCB5F27